MSIIKVHEAQLLVDEDFVTYGWSDVPLLLKVNPHVLSIRAILSKYFKQW